MHRRRRRGAQPTRLKCPLAKSCRQVRRRSFPVMLPSSKTWSNKDTMSPLHPNATTKDTSAQSALSDYWLMAPWLLETRGSGFHEDSQQPHERLGAWLNETCDFRCKVCAEGWYLYWLFLWFATQQGRLHWVWSTCGHICNKVFAQMGYSIDMCAYVAAYDSIHIYIHTHTCTCMCLYTYMCMHIICLLKQMCAVWYRTMNDCVRTTIHCELAEYALASDIKQFALSN